MAPTMAALTRMLTPFITYIFRYNKDDSIAYVGCLSNA